MGGLSGRQKLVFVLLLFGAAALAAWGYFDDLLGQTVANSNVRSAEGLLRSQFMLGVSLGMVLLAVGAYLVPVLLKDIDTSGYHKELLNGLLTAAVFLIFMKALEALNHRYYVIFGLSIVVVSIVFMYCLNRVLAALIASREKQMRVRTMIVGAIVSGMLFSVLVHFVSASVERSARQLDTVVSQQVGKAVNETRSLGERLKSILGH